MSFDILSRHTDIHTSLLLEASAGTGKTYSIEHLYVRLLVEGLNSRAILVMTFTKAATYELGERIRRRIHQTIRYLQGEEGAPDYIQEWINQEKEIFAKRQLQRALIEWEEGEITTLHSFCERRLKEGELDGGVTTLIEAVDLLKVIRDFFRTGLKEPFYSSAQLERVLKRYPDLEEALLQRVQRHLQVTSLPSYEELLEEFLGVSDKKVDAEKVLEDFHKQAPFYKELANRQGELKKEVLERVESFAHLLSLPQKGKEEFEWLIREGVVLVDYLHPAQRKKNYQPPAGLYYPTLVEELEKTWGPLVEQASSPTLLMARMTADIEKLVKKLQEKEEKKRFDDLLHGVVDRLQDPRFVEPIQERFQVAIIDEFQDTDPLQWTILRTLFGKKRLYLVGDPKQAIYAFRQADIYTYLEAEKTFPPEAKKQLTVNFRSQPLLIEALNHFFSTPSLLPLPRLGIALDVPSVQAGSENEWSCQHTKLPLQIWIGEKEEDLLDRTVEEIHRLKTEEAIPFQQWALLVKDRYQAVRVAERLFSAHIPFKMQRDLLLTDTGAREALIDVLDALLHPHDLNRLKRAWGGKLWGLTEEELKNGEKEDYLLPLVEEMTRLRTLWFEKGWSFLFEELGRKSGARLLKEGEEPFYTAWTQLGEWMVEEKLSTPDQCVKFLRRLNLSSDERMKVKSDPFVEAVHIVTIHSSKGLEYDFVVPLGLVSATKEKIEGTILRLEGGKSCFLPITSPSDPLVAQEIEELQAEKMRHLYVAMTRARLRIYLPALFPERKGSPLQLWMKGWKLEGEEALIKWAEKIPQWISYEKIVPKRVYFSPPAVSTSLISPHAIPKTSPPFLIKSFSALTANLGGLTPISFVQKEEKTAHTLPTGREVGLLLHQVMEKWPYGKEETKNFVEEYLKGTFLHEWSSVIHEMITQALRMPLPFSTPFSLQEVNPSYMLREVEFLYQGAPWMKGVIDLVFMHEGRYYFADWKTNWLGPDAASYSPENLQKAMNEHHYPLQATIYREALRKYLIPFDPRPFEEIYGGAAYLFLRGGVWIC